MNQGLHNKDHKPDDFERALPPAYTVDILVEIIQNPNLHKELKIVVLSILYKLITLDYISRYRYDSARKNPYFNEAAKHGQAYIEIFQKLTKYHLEEKIHKKHAKMDEAMNEEIDVNDHTKSQSFLSDFVHFLDNIAK